MIDPFAPGGVRTRPVPVIDVTDLYHPHQDVGDNIDILLPYAHAGIDLRAVVLDATEEFRHPIAHHLEFVDTDGPREPGYIPIRQLDYIFGRNTPHAVGPMSKMSDPADTMDELNEFESAGVDLILHTLETSPDPVQILVFGSARSVAVALNRNPELFERSVERIHLAAGATNADYVEWNVGLDPFALVRLAEGDVPIAVYPCATNIGPFDVGQHNTYWNLPSLDFVERMRPQLQNYLRYALTRECRNDYLAAMDEPVNAEELRPVLAREHHVWETAIWLEVLGEGLRNEQQKGGWSIGDSAIDQALTGGLEPATFRIDSVGRMTFNDGGAEILRYTRSHPQLQERALQEALPRLYESL